MGHKIDLDLTDEQYATLTAAAAKSGQEIKAVIGELLDDLRTRSTQLPHKPNRLLSKQELAEYLYDEGIIASIPTDEDISEEIEIERKRLADFFGQLGGKSASEMAIEDRGPY